MSFALHCCVLQASKGQGRDPSICLSVLLHASQTLTAVHMACMLALSVLALPCLTVLLICGGRPMLTVAGYPPANFHKCTLLLYTAGHKNVILFATLGLTFVYFWSIFIRFVSLESGNVINTLEITKYVINPLNVFTYYSLYLITLKVR